MIIEIKKGNFHKTDEISFNVTHFADPYKIISLIISSCTGVISNFMKEFMENKIL